MLFHDDILDAVPYVEGLLMKIYTLLGPPLRRIAVVRFVMRQPMDFRDSFKAYGLFFILICQLIYSALFFIFQSRFAGSIMHSVQSGYSASHERTLMKGMLAYRT